MIPKQAVRPPCPVRCCAIDPLRKATLKIARTRLNANLNAKKTPRTSGRLVKTSLGFSVPSRRLHHAAHAAHVTAALRGRIGFG
ncbi:MAG: hypothetical protein B7Y58_00240 [Halothiobacillus sp. 35-54-62]|nr:MAG: hypothetical protein B7Y58_00240 [Halothiobacillus sp. 35-54-62]